MTDPEKLDPPDDQGPPDDGLRVPPALVEALRSLEAESARERVPPSVDERILRAARWRLRGLRIRRSRGWVLRLAALILLGMGVWWWTPAPGTPGDVNDDGRIDIRDAFLLALELEGDAEGIGNRARDFDANGRTDLADVGAIARRAVALDPWERREAR